MKLLEHKGKELLQTVGINIPDGIVVENKDYASLSFYKEQYRKFFARHGHVIVKAQVFATSRRKKGLIFDAADYDSSLVKIDALYQRTYGGAPTDRLLIEECVSVAEEYYLSILYDTTVRQPLIIFSRHGGIDIEQVPHADLVKLNPLEVATLSFAEAISLVKHAGIARGQKQVAEYIQNAYRCFIQYDATQVEINPIIKTTSGELLAGDAKITVDDGAIVRHEILRNIDGSEEKSYFTPRELEARQIDQHDYRGVAGKTFVELDGDIAILASGGGASLTAMDALIEAGGRPANYAEYSGNPPREKVKRLTEVTLSKPGLMGCLVVGGTANFTDIYETLSGFVEGLESLPALPRYPIVIRRAGPRDREAFAMMREFGAKHELDITLFGEETPMSYAALVVAEKALQYKKTV